MVAKVCTYGRTRAQAIRRMRRAINETRILGIETNLALHLVVLDDPRFMDGEYDTGLLADLNPSQPEPAHPLLVIAAALTAGSRTESTTDTHQDSEPKPNTWLSHGRRRQLRGAL
jgi:acetyl-CoA carboxylase biotin carboxylase subunit